ncbi:MAG: hypothetical protein HYZ29_29515 [Myxococcales bacterium]|nr:hypothetical protein [Myxococcales bacterium]
MLLVALTRWSRSPSPELVAAEVQVLAPVLGVGAYELRLALSGQLPVVLLETDDRERATGLLADLRGRGHGAVGCDGASVASSATMYSAKTFGFEPNALVFDCPGQPAHRLAHSEVLALLVATHAREEDSSREVREKKLSLSRAALSGGLVRSKTTTVTQRGSALETERVLYVLSRTGRGHALLRETRLHYTGLGTRMGKSTTVSFNTLTEVLRQLLPSALFDDRLLKQRAASSLQVSRTSSSRTVVTSNESDVDVAVHLLALARLQGQL